MKTLGTILGLYNDGEISLNQMIAMVNAIGEYQGYISKHDEQELKVIIDGVLITYRKPRTSNGIDIGDTVYTIGQLRELIANCKDEDLVVLEDTDPETGDAGDLYPFYVDVIDGIQLENGETVSEIRFCQQPNN